MSKIVQPNYEFLRSTERQRTDLFQVFYILPNSIKTDGFGDLNIDQNNFFDSQLAQSNSPIRQFTQDNFTHNGGQLDGSLTLLTNDFPNLNSNVQKNTVNIYGGVKSSIQTTNRDIPENMNINYRELVGNPVTKIMDYWQKQQYNKNTGKFGVQSDYKGTIIKVDLDPQVTGGGFNSDTDLQDNILKITVVEGVVPTSFSEPENDVENSDFQNISVTYTLDNFFTTINLDQLTETYRNYINSYLLPL